MRVANQNLGEVSQKTAQTSCAVWVLAALEPGRTLNGKLPTRHKHQKLLTCCKKCCPYNATCVPSLPSQGLCSAWNRLVVYFAGNLALPDGAAGQIKAANQRSAFFKASTNVSCCAFIRHEDIILMKVLILLAMLHSCPCCRFRLQFIITRLRFSWSSKCFGADTVA